MLFKKDKKDKTKTIAVAPVVPVAPTSIKQAKHPENLENPKIIIEFLPDGNVKPIVFWEKHANVNTVLVANVLNLLNQGKLYEYFKQAVENQGFLTGDVELANAIIKNIKNPKSVEDEKPIIPASMVTRLHFSQQKINSVVEE